jgi:hypothetical protein
MKERQEVGIMSASPYILRTRGCISLAQRLLDERWAE